MKIILDTNVLLISLPVKSRYRPIFNALKAGAFDENKFVDCALAANVDHLVSDDRHFKILENIDFPKLSVIRVDDFLQMVQPRQS